MNRTARADLRPFWPFDQLECRRRRARALELWSARQVSDHAPRSHVQGPPCAGSRPEPVRSSLASPATVAQLSAEQQDPGARQVLPSPKTGAPRQLSPASRLSPSKRTKVSATKSSKGSCSRSRQATSGAAGPVENSCRSMCRRVGGEGEGSPRSIQSAGALPWPLAEGRYANRYSASGARSSSAASARAPSLGRPSQTRIVYCAVHPGSKRWARGSGAKGAARSCSQAPSCTARHIYKGNELPALALQKGA